MKRLLLVTLLVPALMMIACDTTLTVGSKTIGIRSGEFIYSDGYMRATYPLPFERVWEACDKALTGLKATDIERIRKIATGTFTAMVQDEKIRISVDYVEKGMTAISVMAGTGGNNLASQLIHDRIESNLKTP